MNTITISIYKSATGKRPYVIWLNKLDDKSRSIIHARINRARLGNFGDCKQLKNTNGVYELRIDYGPGYRVYFGKKDTTIVILLIGGDKGSQQRDIEKAKSYWQNAKESL